jgi:hypothetical protein
VALFDILGFRELLKKNELDRVAATYLGTKKGFEKDVAHINALNKAFDEKGSVKYHVFSDTILIYTSNCDENSFYSLLVACQSLFNSALQNQLPIRGSIARGELITSGGIEVGKPIVEAHENEQAQDWIGCCITDNSVSEIDKEKYLRTKRIVEYEIPFKNGKVSKKLAFNWIWGIAWKVMVTTKKNHFGLEQIYDEITFFREPASDWTIRRKHDNTKKFVDFVLAPDFVTEYTSGRIS